jgi:general secretion pathway protein M
MTSAYPIGPKGPFGRYLARHPSLGVAGYVGLIVMLLLASWVGLADIYQRRADLAAASDMLDRLEGRKRAGGGTGLPSGPAPAGSPFLEGPTVTVAGAAILQRVSSAVRQFGGNVLSSQVELEGTQSKGGMISVTMSCELDQPQLQQLLYDLEAGMPFLFVEQLVAQAPQGIAGGGGVTGTEGGRLRVLLGVSGQWQEGKPEGKPESKPEAK